MTTDLNTCHLIPRAQADVLRGSVRLDRTPLREELLHSAHAMGQAVYAQRDIADCPGSQSDDSAKRGDRGYIDDYDASAGLWYVSFNRGDAIACTSEEIMP